MPKSRMSNVDCPARFTVLIVVHLERHVVLVRPRHTAERQVAARRRSGDGSSWPFIAVRSPAIVG